MTRTITGLFDSRDEAQAVVDHLVHHHDTSPDHVRMHFDERAGQGGEEKGLWQSLKDLFIADSDRHAYSEGIRRGGYVVTAVVDEDVAEHTLDVFEEHGAVDLDGRTADWGAGGWKIVGNDAIVGGTAADAAASLPEAAAGGVRRDVVPGRSRARSYSNS